MVSISLLLLLILVKLLVKLQADDVQRLKIASITLAARTRDNFPGVMLYATQLR